MGSQAKVSAARRMQSLAAAAATADILMLAERPDVISFAGGLPDPRVFDMEAIREISDRMLATEGRSALNYGPNPGYPPLRAWIADRMARVEGIPAQREEILITTGALEAFHLICGITLEPGDVVLVGEPTYLVALHVLRCFEARPVPIPLDAEGLRVDLLRETMDRLEREGLRPKFLYCIPSFQNPSGLTLSLERRHRLAELAESRSLTIVEDHAYGELRYEGTKLPALKSLVPGRVVFLHTFSKIFGPGVRLGWAFADREIIRQMALFKIGTDQCSSTLAQRLVLRYGEAGSLDRQVAASIPLYRQKRDRLLAALQQHMPSQCSWTRPEGGFFLWVTLPDGARSTALLERALQEEKVAFVAGPPFFTQGGEGFLRLSFSFVSEEVIDEGVERLAKVLRLERQ